MKLFLTIFFLVCTCSLSHATCLAVTPSGSGAKTGADWNNALAFPPSYVRGDIYYFADGNYGSTLNLSTADSGTTVIELRKAQSYDNCTSVGWNTATMGSAQMVIQSPGSGQLVSISSDYWIINGNGNNAGTTEVGCGGVEANPPSTMLGAAPNPAACGIKIDDSTCTSTANDGCNNGVMHGAGINIIWESVEWFGQGLNTNGNNNSEPYFWFACVGGCSGSPTSMAGSVLSHCYCHNMGTTSFTVVNGTWNNGSIDHNYFWGEFDGSFNHGESVQLQGANSGSVIHHNIWRDQQTNGDVVGTDTSGSSWSISIYDNADICSAGGTSTTCRHNDGDIANFGTGIATIIAYNNTWSHPSACGYVIGGGSGSINSTITLKNNLYYDCGSFDHSNGSGGTNNVDYNSYLAMSQGAIGSHDVACSSSCPNPFTNVNLGVQLASDGADWNNRLSVGSPYDTLDLYGNAFTTDRGAAQYVAGGIIAPSSLTGKVTTVGSVSLP